MLDLKVTEHMLSDAKSNKSVGWLYMDPAQFLSLTITDPNVFDWIQKELPHTKTVEEYNSYKTLMPWLDVDMKTGKVVGHEGRHRAAACIKSKVGRIPVAIILRDRGYSHYYSQPFIDENDNPKQLAKVFVTRDDVPHVLVGQFVHRSVMIDPKQLHEFWAAHNTKARSIQAVAATSLEGMKKRIAGFAQGKSTAGLTENCWITCGKFIYQHNLTTGNVLVFGEATPFYAEHAIVLDTGGRTVCDTYRGGGFYLPSAKAYRHHDGQERALIATIPVSELLNFPLES